MARGHFRLNAAGIRAAFSAKVKDGKLKPDKGMYVPVGTNPDELSAKEKVDLILEYSIFAPVRGQWTQGTLDEFDAMEAKLMNQAEARAKKYKITSVYDVETKTIKFLGRLAKLIKNSSICSCDCCRKCGLTRHIGIECSNVLNRQVH